MKNTAIVQPEEVVKVNIYGHVEDCIILANRDFGTFDVQRIRDGKCFRVSGLADQS